MRWPSITNKTNPWWSWFQTWTSLIGLKVLFPRTLAASVSSKIPPFVPQGRLVPWKRLGQLGHFHHDRERERLWGIGGAGKFIEIRVCSSLPAGQEVFVISLPTINGFILNVLGVGHNWIITATPNEIADLSYKRWRNIMVATDLILLPHAQLLQLYP